MRLPGRYPRFPKVLLLVRHGALALDVITQGRSRVIFVGGELDTDTSPVFRRIAADVWLCAPGRVLLSLWACTFCDGRGIEALLAIRERVGPRLRIVLPRQAGTRLVLELAGITERPGPRPSAHDAFFASGLRG